MDFKSHKKRHVPDIRNADARVVGERNTIGTPRIAILIRTSDQGVLEADCRLSMSPDEARTLIEATRKALAAVGEQS